MGGIGIVGTGISGLHLALYLQRAGVDTTVYSAQTADELRAGRLPNLVVRWAPTIDRERELGVFRWGSDAVEAVHLRVAGDPPLGFCGRLSGAAYTTDFRIYLPALLDDYRSRGGNVVVGSVEPADLEHLARDHDLIVVAAGRDGFGGMFPRDAARSPHEQPARHIAAGLYNGVGWPTPAGVEFVVVPGAGEIFQVCFHSFDGPVSGLSVEAIPGGPLDVLPRVDGGDPRVFESAVLGLLETYAPSIHERVDRNVFGLTRSLDLLQGRLTPVVRKAWAPLGDGKHAMAIGDAWILNDPIAAQGANLGSRCAFRLGQTIAASGGPYDDAFCRHVEAELWAAAAAPTMLSNALLAPPPPEVFNVLARAAQDQQTADRFVSGFGDPEGMLAMFAPEPAAC